MTVLVECKCGGDCEYSLFVVGDGGLGQISARHLKEALRLFSLGVGLVS